MQWLDALADRPGRAAIKARLLRLEAENFEDCKSLCYGGLWNSRALRTARIDSTGDVRAGLAFDDDGLAEGLCQLCTDGARHHIGRAAWREGHEDSDRLGRPQWVFGLREYSLLA